jgi:hypothetical protein
MFSGEAANTNFLVFSLTWQWFDQTVDPTVVWPDVYGLIRLHREPNIYPVRGKHANYYTNDSVETGYILSECCLSCEQHFIYIMTCEQHFIYIMTRTTFYLYHDKNNISSISWQEQTIWWDDDDADIVLNQHPQLDLKTISRKTCSSYTLSWLRANQSLLLIQNVV